MGCYENLICCKCGVALEARKTEFDYLGFSFNTELPGCPVCGLAFIPEDVVEGRMAAVEMELEEK